VLLEYPELLISTNINLSICKFFID